MEETWLFLALLKPPFFGQMRIVAGHARGQGSGVSENDSGWEKPHVTTISEGREVVGTSVIKLFNSWRCVVSVSDSAAYCTRRYKFLMSFELVESCCSQADHDPALRLGINLSRQSHTVVRYSSILKGLLCPTRELVFLLWNPLIVNQSSSLAWRFSFSTHLRRSCKRNNEICY